MCDPLIDIYEWFHCCKLKDCIVLYAWHHNLVTVAYAMPQRDIHCFARDKKADFLAWSISNNDNDCIKWEFIKNISNWESNRHNRRVITLTYVCKIPLNIYVINDVENFSTITILRYQIKSTSKVLLFIVHSLLIIIIHLLTFSCRAPM